MYSFIDIDDVEMVIKRLRCGLQMSTCTTVMCFERRLVQF